ncbi:MAG: mandelate racemase/muconate lactonizing enzyme family protein [Verrucomicrobiales bacterium]|nr:mandelate racemase/muconate lactonizing enzyme family protein [Verrucomicrobiales bacterium]
MRITDVKTVLLTGPCTGDPFLLELRKWRSAAFIEIHTDDPDLVGLGETYAGYFCPEIIPETVAFFKDILLGQNVDNIPALWERMYHCGNFWCRVGLGASVLSGIEAALWDLKGKLEGKPVCELLGGLAHEKLFCYATGGPSNYPVEYLAEKLDFYQSLGFKAAKLGVGSYSKENGSWLSNDPDEAADFEAAKLEFVRSRYGGAFQLMLDGHMGNSSSHTWDTATAIAVAKACEPYDLFFFEEPLHYTDPLGYAELCASTTVPIAGGECLTADCEWRLFIERDCFDIGQPDAGFMGGLSEFMKVAKRFADKDRKIATHAWGAGGVFMQNLHCGFACPNTAILEIPPAWGPLHSEVIGDSFEMVDGHVLPPHKPGLGIVLSDETKAAFPFVRGSGEYNNVPGKILPEQREKHQS